MLSYKKLITLNKKFADNHWVIKNFGNGERWQIVDHDQTPSFKYPLMFVEDLPFSGQTKEFTYNLRVWFVTRVEAPTDRGSDLLYSEYAAAKSAMVKCALDLVSYWVQDVNYSSLEIDKNFNIETFIDKTKDRDTGCYIDLRFREVFTYDSCIVPMDGATPPPSETCDPATITINGGDSQSVASGGSLDISVHDTADNDIGTVSGSEVEISDTTLTVNGSSITNVKAEGSKAITIRYADDSPVTVTTITDTESVFICEVPNSVSGIAYVRNAWTVRNTNYNTHDLGWYLANEPSVFSYNVTGQTPILDPDDNTKLLTNNAFGNLNRVTNSLGLTATYDGTGGEIADYAIDHFTGQGWYLQNAVATNVDFVNSATTLRAATLATFDDWRMVTMMDAANILTDDGGGLPSHIFASIESWTTDLTWIMNSTSAGTGYFWRLNQHIGASIWMNTRSITSPNPSIMTIATRNHY